MGFKPIPAAVALVLTLLIWFVIPRSPRRIA